MGRARKDITGQVFNEIYTVIEDANDTDTHKHPKWFVKCFRDHIFKTTYSDLNRGRLKLCPACREIESELSPIKSLMYNYVRNAKKRKLEFSLELWEFKLLILQNCQYCGSEPTQFHKKPEMKVGIYYNGIDRKNNSIGYKMGNCITACKFCNFAKGKSSYEDFQNWITRLTDFRIGMPEYRIGSEKGLYSKVTKHVEETIEKDVLDYRYIDGQKR